MDMILLRVMDKINSFEDTLNHRFASFETQLQKLSHSTPSSAGEADKDFEVTLFICKIAPVILTLV